MEPATPFTIKKLYEDQELIGRLFLQTCLLRMGLGSRELDQEFNQGILQLMHKLAATKYHLDNYERVEAEQLSKYKDELRKSPQSTFESFELIFELEAFFFQLKSSLDMLVKILVPLVGKQRLRTHTYEDKGKRLQRGLEKYRKQKGVNKWAIDNMIEFITDARDSWIEAVVDYRDRLAHKAGLIDYGFVAGKDENGNLAPVKPKIGNVDTLEQLKIVYKNNLLFCQDFVCLAKCLPVPGLRLRQARPESISDFGPEFAEYFRWEWVLVKED